VIGQISTGKVRVPVFINQNFRLCRGWRRPH